MKLAFFLLLAGCGKDYGLVELTPEMKVEPLTLDFGVHPPGDLEVESFRIRNEGRGPLWVSEVRVEGGAFALLSNAEGEVESGEEVIVDVGHLPDEDQDVGRVVIRAANQRDVTVSLAGALEPLEASFGALEIFPEGTVLQEGEELEVTLEFEAHGGLDLSFLLDTTQSMNALADTVSAEFSNIADDVSDVFADASWGLATYEDYSRYPYGSAGRDVPFRLRAAQSTDRDVVQDALVDVDINQGQDAPESTLEALYQGITGAGYDMGCDGVYHEGFDVLPYIASPDDPFGGLGGQSGTEGSGGFGFRPGRIPILVYATNYELRDADDERYTTPGGCPKDAGMTDVVDALAAVGGRAVAVAVNVNAAGYTVQQMNTLAERTSSVADLDGDGTSEPAVVVWSGSSGEFHDTVTEAILQLATSLQWGNTWVEVDDPYGLVVGITPEVREDVQSGDTVRFVATLRGVDLPGPTILQFRLVTDGGVVLDSTWIRISDE